MILVPAERLEGRTRLPQAEVASRISRFLEDPPPPQVPASVTPTWGPRYKGIVTNTTFRLTAVAKFKQPYLPTFAGDFSGDAEWTRIRGTLNARPGEVATLGIGALAISLYAASFTVVGMAMAAHAFGYLFGFLPHVNALRAWLEGLPDWEWSRRTTG
jgi:hypothetical protein